jgi:hypothetical protein
MLKWNGHVVCMVDNRWPTQILTLSPEGRRRGRLEVKWVGSLDGYEAEELNNRRRSKPAIMATENQ